MTGNKYLEEYKQLQLRKCQLKQLTILEEIDRICQRHGITYWLDGGSILGAVRHKGFIPWDDDIDIAMPLADMQRFISLAPKELPGTLRLQTPQNEDTKEPIVKVRDINSFYVEPDDDFSASYGKGLYVDIFPFVDYPTVSRKWAKKVLKGISKSYSILHKKHYYSMRSTAEFFWFGLQYILYSAAWHIANIVGRHGTMLGNVPINNGYGIMHRRDSIFPVGKVIFEGKEFAAPCNPDAYLKDLYHNYMDIPPVEKQKIHSIFITTTLVGNNQQ